jgi:hypothetical protein
VEEVTRLSKSKTPPGVAAIGNSRVIPAKAGIQVAVVRAGVSLIGPRPAPGGQRG